VTIVLSSGHGKLIRGASGYIDEVDEARRVVAAVAEYLAAVGVDATVFNDDVSKTQDENLERIVDFHNSKTRDLDVSVHFNAYQTTEEAMGCECLYLSQQALAGNVVEAICGVSGLKSRGPKKRTDLFFLNNTDQPAILIEVCFVDSEKDTELYRAFFHSICGAITEAISGTALPQTPEEEPSPPLIYSALCTIPPVTIYQSPNGAHVKFLSDLDICNDGTGPAHGDPYHQSQTAYYNKGKFLNADKDKYIVIPPQIRSMVSGVVMGCQGRATNTTTGVSSDGVIGEIGPEDKTGEAAYCLAKILNPSITYNSGDTNRIYLYELWPDVPAKVETKTYSLEPA
jgi:N-acetylmuramoyl-L-alanine amidase